MTVCVVGLGHIGLPTALLLAQDHDVVGVDIDAERVAILEDGELPFEEPGMRNLFESVQHHFTATTNIPRVEAKVSREEVMVPPDDSEVQPDGRSPIDTYLIATPTPIDDVTQVPNLEYVRAAADSVAEVLAPGDLVVLESTVPPGTSQRLIVPILQQSNSEPDGFDYAYCPERALPGNTVQEMVHNDRVVGGVTEAARSRAVGLYGFVEGEIFTTDPISAEFIKVIENTYRDVNIALANELGKLAELYGLDGRAAIEIANRHPRVDILSPGPGVGGHCLPIDPQFLTQLSENPRLISLARNINDKMPVHVLRLIRELIAPAPNRRLCVLGVAYKGGVDDVRQTPARRIIRLAENEGYDIRVHDPHVETFDYPILDFETAVDGSDCLVLVTDHPEYANLDPASLAGMMRRMNVLDTRGIIDRTAWKDCGFTVRQLADGT